MIRAALVVLATFAFVACSGGHAGPTGPRTLALGTGDTTYVPLAAGDPIPAYQGPQGGFHVYLDLRATGVLGGDPTAAPTPCTTPGPNPCIDLDVIDTTTGKTLDDFQPLRLGLVAAPDGVTMTLPRRRLVPLAIHALAEVDGHMFTVRAHLDDGAGPPEDDSVAVECVAQRPADGGLLTGDAGTGSNGDAGLALDANQPVNPDR